MKAVARRTAEPAARRVAVDEYARGRRARPGRQLSIQREADRGPLGDDAAMLARSVLDSPGRPLDAGTRSFMEPRLGHDFGSVRVHTDAPAARSAQAMSANAYTAGNHVVFGGGKFAPGTLGGQRLIAHELTHVIQQARGPVPGTPIGNAIAVSNPADPFERDAAAVATLAATDRSATQVVSPLDKLPSAPSDPGQLSMQRDAAGVISAIAGVAALAAAAFAWLMPKNPAPTSGGINFNVNPNPLVFPFPKPNAPETIRSYNSAIEGPWQVHKVLDLSTDTDNHAVLNLKLKTDGKNIISGVIEQGETKNYAGGSAGSSAVVNFNETAQPIVPETPAPAPESPAQAPPEKPAEPVRQTGGAPTAAPPAPVAGGPAPQSGPTSTSPLSETILSFNGTNTLGESFFGQLVGKHQPPQGFAGDISVKGDGKVECLRCAPTNNIGIADKVGSGPDSFGRVAYTYAAFRGSGAPLPAPTPGKASPFGPGGSTGEPEKGDFPQPPKNERVA